MQALLLCNSVNQYFVIHEETKVLRPVVFH